MSFRRAVPFLIIAALGAPLALAVTLLSWSFWGWLEAATGIESLGHSGPASWCYLFVYLLLIGLFSAVNFMQVKRSAS